MAPTWCKSKRCGGSSMGSRRPVCSPGTRPKTGTLAAATAAAHLGPGTRQQLLPHICRLDAAIIAGHVAAGVQERQCKDAAFRGTFHGNNKRAQLAHKHLTAGRLVLIPAQRPSHSQLAGAAVGHEAPQLGLLVLRLIVGEERAFK